MKRIAAIAGLSILALILMVPGASLYYESGSGKGCTKCHEMNSPYDLWHTSSHRDVDCAKCHGGAFTPDVSFHWNNASRVYYHVKGELPERIKVRNVDVLKMVERCQSCHRQEFAQWQSGPHSATYSRIFLDKTHNSNRQLMDDCLRCHGMHFEGGIRELVAPLDRSGPWRMVTAGLADRPSMPCLTCHTVHRTGPQLRKTGVEGRVKGPAQEINRPSLAFFDRRTQQHVPVSTLPLPVMLEGDRVVKMSPDRRQALCYQCHAADATRQVGSGDDRTGLGVHEGISCLACHQKHGQKTRASCAECHPRWSNCGLDVEKMDTTFLSPTSKHNIHWVKCVDCHPKGIPKKRAQVAEIQSALSGN
ncbi:MAG: multiheme c-type cytochrome [Bryobacteraceae bacterium]